MRYVLGIDAGGTKTMAAAVDETGAVQAEFTVGATNINSEPQELVLSRLDHLAAQARQRFPKDECAAICAATAGYSNPDTARVWNQAFSSFEGRFLIVGDQEAALEGALDGQSGVVVIAGTGSICMGRTSQGKTARSGGFGHLLDDGGSGYAIGLAMLSAVVRAQDGRAAQTLLTDVVHHALGTHSLSELIRAVYAPNQTKSFFAALAPLLDKAVEEGDTAAQQIAASAADELFVLSDTVCKKLALQKGLCALSGGILQNSKPIRAAFSARMAAAYPQISCVAPLRSACQGAALLALRSCGPRKEG